MITSSSQLWYKPSDIWIDFGDKIFSGFLDDTSDVSRGRHKFFIKGLVYIVDGLYKKEAEELGLIDVQTTCVNDNEARWRW